MKTDDNIINQRYTENDETNPEIPETNPEFDEMPKYVNVPIVISNDNKPTIYRN